MFNKLLPRTGRRGWSHSAGAHIWRAITGHHGKPPASEQYLFEDVICDTCVGAAQQFVQTLGEVFNPPAWTCPADEQVVVRMSWRLAGLTTLADWIGSNQCWFPYVLLERLRTRRAISGRMLCRALRLHCRLPDWRRSALKFDGLRGLFPKIQTLTPIQRWSETVELPAGPVLAVIQDLTGSGKTEAAMTLAHRLMASGRASGIYVALPTMATANAMFSRAAGCYRALFASDARPSLALAHGHAWLDPRFATAIDGVDNKSARTETPADEPAEAHCAAWLADDRRRALLAQVGVGTVDQALLSVLPVRHAVLRLQGLANKVLIVDECHAFDFYTGARN